jgi:hypothetical protein
MRREGEQQEHGVGLLTRLVVALRPNRGGGGRIQRGRKSEARGPARLPGSPPPSRVRCARARGRKQQLVSRAASGGGRRRARGGELASTMGGGRRGGGGVVQEAW